MKICDWAKEEPNKTYHNTIWGKPEHDDQKLFEFLILEGAQAGLSWTTILKRKNNYQKVFLNYDLEKLANLTDEQLNEILLDERIIRNRLKVYSVRKNAIGFLKIQAEYGTFAKYIWGYVDNKQIINFPKEMADIPASDELSLKISKDLKKWGFNFVGPTIIYSYLQAIGIIDDHLVDCICKKGLS
ncbi:MAG: DNA-3-methyladenine glycosylase I [Mycoplasmatales bacterium]